MGRITEVYIQSDGASNFSGTGFLLGLGLMTSRIAVIGHMITEAGGGKDVTDQDFADLGKQLLSALLTGKDVITSKDIASVANGESRKKSSMTLEVVIERNDTATEPKTKSGIQDMYFRRLSYSASPSSESGRRLDKIVIFNFYGIGHGATIESKEVQGLLNSDNPDMSMGDILKCMCKSELLSTYLIITFLSTSQVEVVCLLQASTITTLPTLHLHPHHHFEIS